MVANTNMTYCNINFSYLSFFLASCFQCPALLLTVAFSRLQLRARVFVTGFIPATAFSSPPSHPARPAVAALVAPLLLWAGTKVGAYGSGRLAALVLAL